MRSSEEPKWWRALRAGLHAEGVAPADAAVGEIYPEDVMLSGGVIPTRDGRAFRFELDWWFDEGDERKSPDDAELTEWEPLDLADAVPSDIEFVAVARAVLREDGPAQAG